MKNSNPDYKNIDPKINNSNPDYNNTNKKRKKKKNKDQTQTQTQITINKNEKKMYILFFLSMLVKSVYTLKIIKPFFFIIIRTF